MYSLLTNVQVGGTTVDDDVTTFGIRSLVFNSGLTLNGKSHQDSRYGQPSRLPRARACRAAAGDAEANRAAQDHRVECVAYGARSAQPGIPRSRRTEWECSCWTSSRTSGPRTSTRTLATTRCTSTRPRPTPTGMPALPTAATGTKWWEVDFTGYIMRDRNHPSVALYSMGNEIHDSHWDANPNLQRRCTISRTRSTRRTASPRLCWTRARQGTRPRAHNGHFA